MEEKILNIYTKTGILLETVVGKLRIEKDDEQKCYRVFGAENKYDPIVKVSTDDVIITLSAKDLPYSKIITYLGTILEQR